MMSAQNQELTLSKTYPKVPRELTLADITRYVDQLVKSDERVTEQDGFVFRTRRHTISWFLNYIQTELTELDEVFVTDSKHFECCFVHDAGKRFLEFRFKLMTKGLQGGTEYGIKIQRVGEFFACKE